MSLPKLTLGLVLTSVLLSSGTVRAIYVRSEIERVPVDRVVRNLEQVAGREPRNVEVRLNLARAHAMAYALKANTLPMTRSSNAKPQGPALEDGRSSWVPYAMAKPEATSPAAAAAARAHLDQALDAYEAVLRLEPGDMVARLGYGWCLQQAGYKTAAIRAYRDVIADAWPRERTRRTNALMPTVTEEAAGYLIPLLDAAQDKEEIARLRSYIAESGKLPRAITPVVVPLDARRTGVESLVDHQARVRFDADGTALDRRWTWVSQDAGWLVYDGAGTGEVTSALQLFGNVTFWMFWSNGYQAMRALDDNQDGTLAGEELRGLAIWRDANGNGVSERGEVRSLEEWGIVSLSCAYDYEDESDAYVASSSAGVTFVDGTTRPTYDILLHRRAE